MFKKVLLTLVIVLLGVGQAFTADIYNVGTVRDLRSTTISSYDNLCGYYEHGDQVTYVYKTTWIDSSNARHSKPFYVGDLNAADAYCRAIMSAASDCNVNGYGRGMTWHGVCVRSGRRLDSHEGTKTRRQEGTMRKAEIVVNIGETDCRS